jgi:hypothetical protein
VTRSPGSVVRPVTSGKAFISLTFPDLSLWEWQMVRRVSFYL